MLQTPNRPTKLSARAPGLRNERLDDFARAMGQRDRSAHRRWLSDEDVENAIRGYAYAVAVAEQTIVALPAGEVDRAIAIYRRTRRLPPHPDSSQRHLIAVIDGRPESGVTKVD